MKAYLAIESHGQDNPIQRALSHVLPVFGHEATETLDEASVAITNSTNKALSLLKEKDGLRILVMCTNESDKVGALALAKNFPGRVSSCGITNFVVTMMKTLGGEES